MPARFILPAFDWHTNVTLPNVRLLVVQANWDGRAVRIVNNEFAKAVAKVLRQHRKQIRAELPKVKGLTRKALGVKVLRVGKVRRKVRISINTTRVPYAGFIRWQPGQGPRGAQTIPDFFRLYLIANYPAILRAVTDTILNAIRKQLLRTAGALQGPRLFKQLQRGFRLNFENQLAWRQN